MIFGLIAANGRQVGGVAYESDLRSIAIKVIWVKISSFIMVVDK